MFRLICILSLVGVLGNQRPTLAQFPNLKPNPGGGWGGVKPDQFYQSNVSLAANQLAVELNGVQVQIAQGNIPFAQKAQLAQHIEASIRATQGLIRLSSLSSDRKQFSAADQVIDLNMQKLAASFGGFIPAPALSDAMTRAQYGEQQLHAAVYETPAPGPGVVPPAPGDNPELRVRIIRLAESLVDQNEQLRQLVNQTPNSNAINLALRTFGSRVTQIRNSIENGTTLIDATIELQKAQAQWQFSTQLLNTVVVQNPQLRLQAARVGSLFETLTELITGNNLGGITDPPIDDGFGFVARGMIAVGAGEGGGPRVRVFARVGGAPIFDFFAYDPNFRGGVRVAMADLNGDNIPDLVTAPGGAPPGTPPMPPLVRVFDGRTMKLFSEFLAYDRNWTGGVFVAASDMGQLGKAVVVTSPDIGAGPHIKAFDVRNGRELDSFFAYDVNSRCGARVSLGDVDGDNVPDIIVSSGPQMEPRVKVFSGNGRRVLADFLAYDRSWTGGVWVAAADISRNGRADLIVGADVGGPNTVRVFDCLRGKHLGDVQPFPNGFRCGTRVAAYDVDGDGVLDVICAPGPGVPAPIQIYSGRNQQLLQSFTPFEPNFAGGVFIGAK